MGFFSNLTGNGKGLGFSDSLKYLKDYKTETVTDEKGRQKKRARYIGPWYFVTTDPKISKIKMTASLVLGVMACVCHIMLPLQKHFGMDKYPVLVPILFALFPLMYLMMGLCSLPFSMKPMHRDRHAHSFMRASKSCVAVALMLAVALIALFIYRIALGDFMFLSGDWIFTGLLAAEIVILIVIIWLLYTVEREEKPNSAYDEGILK